MNADAALDHFAFVVGLRLMGPDARRRLRIALARDPALTVRPGFDVERAERLEELAEGTIPAETLQERLDLARVERERLAPPFEAGFWLARRAELVLAGFVPAQADRLIGEVRYRVEAEPMQRETVDAG